MTHLRKYDRMLLLSFSIAVLTMPIWMAPLGAAYPALLQKFAIYALFAIGFNILFGLTGYLSFGHAAFLGAGSYAAVWAFKLLTLNAVVGVLAGTLVGAAFALGIGFFSLRRSGIYFSILTLAFAQMSYNLAYSVLMPITNGETGLRLLQSDARILDTWIYGTQRPASVELFGLSMAGYNGFYFCAVVLILGFYLSIRITRSPFGTMLRAIKSNQTRLSYSGINVRPYALAAFVISGAYAGLAGALLAVTDPLAGPERMQWTASGEVVLMTILGGVGTLVGPVLGATIIKYLENIFSSINDSTLNGIFSFLPTTVREVAVNVLHQFVGEGWQLTLGIIFMLLVAFLPGGVVQGIRKAPALIRRVGQRRGASARSPVSAQRLIREAK